MKKWVTRSAVSAANTSTFGPMKHGAVVEKGGRIISIGVNSVKPRTPQSYTSIHAEVAAISLAGGHAKGSDLYVARIGTKGNLGMSKPCTSCQSAIYQSGIKRVFYTNNDGIWISAVVTQVGPQDFLRRIE